MERQDLVRSVKEFSVKAVVTMINGEDVEVVKLPSFKYTGRKMSDGALRTHFAEINGCDEQHVMILEHKSEDKMFKCNYEKFLEIAEEVKDEPVEE
nr:MAG TPA: hypothetical protein [Caudoviricetes sp.]